MSIYDYEYISIEGAKVSLKEYEGHPMLIVNTASKCGYTYQYDGLQKLYEEYKDRGLVIIGFPCNQFLKQDPKGNDEIHEFCKIRYGVSFPLSEKVDVRGENKIPLFAYLISEQGFKGFPKKKAIMNMTVKGVFGKDELKNDEVKWNFTKFLIDKEGKVIARYEPMVDPEDIKEDIEKVL